MRTVAVFGSSRTAAATDEWHAASDLGFRLAEAGFRVATGGYAGTMEAVSEGAHRARGHVIGVTAAALFPHRSGPNSYVTEVRDYPTLSSRIASLVDESDGFIVLPGSLGTATELLVAWNSIYVDSFRSSTNRPLIVVGQTWKVLVMQLAASLQAPFKDIVLTSNAAEAAATMIENLAKPV